MSFRPLLLASAAVTALALPGAAQAQTSTYSASCAGEWATPTIATVASAQAATLCLINAERTRRGLGRLRSVDALDDVSAAYARRMVRQDFFEHTSPDGGTFVSRIKSTGYLRGAIRRWSIGENIAWGTGWRAAPAAVVASWMRSPGHRANILNPGFTELGLGVAIGAPRAGAGRRGATYVNAFGERRR